MSIAAMNWALAQRLESPQQQILLYVIADSADPNGVTRHCDPDYMADRTRLSRASVFRRLGELEAQNLLQRLKFYSERGAPIYELRLNLEARIDAAMETPAPDSAAIGEGNAAMEARPESQAETLVGETRVSAVRPAQSHSCDSICPPVSKNPPPNPPPGGMRSREEIEQGRKRDEVWSLFRASYPGIGTMDQAAAREAFDALTPEDAEWATGVLPALKDELRVLKKPPRNAHLWLRKRMFENYPRTPIAAPEPEAVWIEAGSEADRALRYLCRLSRAVTPLERTCGDGSGARGYYRRQPIGPDMLAMLAFAESSDLRWPEVERASPNAAAWQARMAEWTGRPLPVTAARNDPAREVIRVPCPWPPKVDGTVYAWPEPAAGDDDGEGDDAGLAQD